MAALRGCNVDNALIEIDGPEVPIMDGSSDTFVSMIDAVGVVDQGSPRKAILIHKPVKAHEFDKYAMLLPDHSSSFSMAIYYPETMIGYQKYSIKLSAESFARDISRARTFGFRRQIEHMRNQDLLRGGSLKNAVVVDDYDLLNEDGLRFDDEFVRHKLLDSIGDLYLAGMPIIGHFHAYKTGHLLNQILLIKLFSDTDAWSYVNLDEVEQAQSTHKGKYTSPIAEPTDQILLNIHS
jgi:UDP-3-O-[3-hydroxymyristoyl] N-acetylglucosamine deacetylase